MAWICAACSSDHGAGFDLSGREDGGATFQPQVSIAIDDPSVTEGNAGTSSLTFSLTLSMRAERTITVDYASRGATAQPQSDFIGVKGKASFAPGETVQQIHVQVVGDLIDEDDESIELVLANPVGAVLTDAVGIGTIQDDDQPPSVSVGAGSVLEGDSGKTKLLFPVTLSAASGKTITVNYTTEDGSAVAPDDYDSANGVLTFAPGAVAKSVIVVLNGDLEAEGDESLSLVLDSPVNAVISAGEADGMIMDDDSPASGLLERPSNLTCIAPDAPVADVEIENRRVFPNIPVFSQPVAMLQAPSDSSKWYMAEQGGRVYWFANDNGTDTKTEFVDLTSMVDASFSESGLLGIAFHPDYANNRFVYISYTATGPGSGFPLTSRLSRFESNDNGATLDPTTETVLISLDQPFNYHNGGHIVFGPDGYLYMGFGDGGGNASTFGSRSQNTRNLFGSVLRIDVDGSAPYGIPTDNPFSSNGLCNANEPGVDSTDPCPEIYAWGFRNPWRFNFDDETGQLWLGDVGEHAYEEVNIVELGGNYGWNIQEGETCFEPAIGCDISGLVQPVIVYDHEVGQSITGGFVYRGVEIPELVGRYFFVDFINQQIMASIADENGNYDYEILYRSNLQTSSLIEDENGELLALRYTRGEIHKFRKASGAANNTIPTFLSQTGCVDEIDPTQPADGLIPYETVVNFWSDSAEKERHYAIPDGATVDVDAEHDWQFPVGSVLVKHFRLGGPLIETRLFMRHTEGEWAGYTYEWNDEQTDAVRVIGGKSKQIAGQQWTFPSEIECMRCHTDAAKSTLGLEHAQLNKSILYPATGISANQLTTADAIDVLTDPLPDVPSNLPALVQPADPGEPLDARVRSYLHVNCSGCHRPSGPTPSSMDLRYGTSWADTNTCDVVPSGATLGIPDARIIAPGDAARSVLLARINRRDVYGMPPLASNLVDADGFTLLESWINGLTVCP